MKKVFRTLTGMVTVSNAAHCDIHNTACVEVKHIPHSGIGIDRYCVSTCISATAADAFTQNDAEAFSAKVDYLMQGRAA